MRQDSSTRAVLAQAARDADAYTNSAPLGTVIGGAAQLALWSTLVACRAGSACGKLLELAGAAWPWVILTAST